jgi:hypothetical protein
MFLRAPDKSQTNGQRNCVGRGSFLLTLRCLRANLTYDVSFPAWVILIRWTEVVGEVLAS